MRDKISLCKNTGWTRCACGALPGAYHAQICGDQNALQHIYVRPEYVETISLKDGSFAGFMLSRNFDDDKYIIDPNDYEKSAFAGGPLTEAFAAEPERGIVKQALKIIGGLE